MPKKRINKYVFDTNDQLGHGSFGVVYKALVDYPKEKPQIVAIKVLKKKRVDYDKHAKESFLSEIKVLKKVVSPNVVGFKEVIETENNYYIVQEYCDGGDLQQLLAQRKILSEEEAIKMMIEILTGFFDIMRCGIVHRDFKPQNVLISKGKLKIADFGLARPSGQAMDSEVGTPHYQSPQILNGDVYSNKCDIWAIGLVFYQVIVALFKMLYGKLPWECKGNTKKYYKQIMKRHLQFPNQINISQQVKLFITNCLQKNQSSRADWAQIFRNDIFNNHLPNYEILDQIFVYALNQIQSNIEDNHYNLVQIFRKFNSNGQSQTSMPRKDFNQMIRKLAPNVKRYHMDFIISKFDKNSDGLIDFQQFRTTLLQKRRQIRTVLSSQEMKTVLFRWAEQNQDQFMQKCRKQWRQLKLRLTLKFAQITSQSSSQQIVHELFKKYGVKGNEGKRKLNLEQFTNLLKSIDQKFSSNECFYLFQSFDKNKDQEISFQQFINQFPKLIQYYEGKNQQNEKQEELSFLKK